jgi:hypothetical protein
MPRRSQKMHAPRNARVWLLRYLQCHCKTPLRSPAHAVAEGLITLEDWINLLNDCHAKATQECFVMDEISEFSKRVMTQGSRAKARKGEPSTPNQGIEMTGWKLSGKTISTAMPEAA